MTTGAQTIGNHDCRLLLCHAIGDLFQIRHNFGGWPCQVIFIPCHFNKCVCVGGWWYYCYTIRSKIALSIRPSVHPSVCRRDVLRFLMVHGHCKFMGLTTLNIAVQIMNLIMHRGHVRTRPSIPPSVTNFVSLSLS